jgi:hypothetical protein
VFVVEGPRNTVGEDDGAAILVTEFKSLLLANTGGVVVGGGLSCLIAVDDVRFSEVGVVEMRRFLRRGIGVPSFSLSESISTRPRGGGRPAFVGTAPNIIIINNVIKPHHQ